MPKALTVVEGEAAVVVGAQVLEEWAAAWVLEWAWEHAATKMVNEKSHKSDFSSFFS